MCLCVCVKEWRRLNAVFAPMKTAILIESSYSSSSLSSSYWTLSLSTHFHQPQNVFPPPPPPLLPDKSVKGKNVLIIKYTCTQINVWSPGGVDQFESYSNEKDSVCSFCLFRDEWQRRVSNWIHPELTIECPCDSKSQSFHHCIIQSIDYFMAVQQFIHWFIHSFIWSISVVLNWLIFQFSHLDIVDFMGIFISVILISKMSFAKP